ncbi:DUF2555 domain-containing protein [Anthocerotibacter panamensis]|uniref:DUF2555 domain-containing protein n=1 Tax=Anthocerotibacter panamensis TaxID=2857077 RepID=UPI001C404AB3|nr:DUF2555 domain-containing protein [Anthocerotibacter panamensis]
MTTTLHKPLDSWTLEDVTVLAERLERDQYPNVTDALEDWHLLKALQYARPELVAPYSHLLELETDED